jgi:hypothetical protein
MMKSDTDLMEVLEIHYTFVMALITMIFFLNSSSEVEVP